MDVWIRAVLIIVCSVMGSGGLWAYLQSRDTKKNATTRLLMGMAYDQITGLGVGYIERGWISKDEYEELQKYFFDPYKELGGNGVAERIMNRVSNLPMRSQNRYVEILRRSENEGWTDNVRVVTRSGEEASPQ